MNRTRFIFFMILTLAWLCVIYSFSLEPADTSKSTSQGLIDLLVETFLPWFSDELTQLQEQQMDVLQKIVRKGAHFTEYFILGVLSSTTVLQTNVRRISVYSIVFCIVAASIDETIQLFVEGRAGMISDVVLDSTGAAVGVGVVLLVMARWKQNSSMIKNLKENI